MQKWFSYSHYQRLYRFFGKRVILLFFIGIGAGTFIFAADFALAYGLQAFFLVLDIAKEESLQIVSWVPTQSLKWVLCFVFATIVIRAIFQWVAHYVSGAAQEWFRQRYRSYLLNWTFGRDSASTSDVSTLFNERVNLGAKAVSDFQSLGIFIEVVLFLLIALCWISPLLTLLNCIIFIVLYPLFKGLNGKIKEAGENVIVDWDQTNSRLMMSIKNLLLLRLYNMQNKEEVKVQKTLFSYAQNTLKYHFFSGALLIMPQVVGMMVILVVLYFSKTYLSIKPGVLVTYFYLFLRLLQNLSMLGRATSLASFNFVQLREVAQWWSEKEIDQFQMKRREEISREEKEVETLDQLIGFECKNLSFRYSEKEPYIFEKFNLTIKPGETMVIKGASGSGKSTLLSMLLGQVKAKEGEILLNLGSEKAEIEKKKSLLLHHVGYVGPESFLIEGSIYDNLVYGLERKLSDEEIQTAIQKAECQFIDELSEGLSHVITEQGQGLSAGQKQRLSMARALLRNPKVLILDEATANLDIETEKKLVQTFSHLKGAMTIIAVTHKPEILKIADEVIDLDLS